MPWPLRVLQKDSTRDVKINKASPYRLSISSSFQGCFSAHETEGQCVGLESALESSPTGCPRSLPGDGPQAHQPPSPPPWSVWVVPSLCFCKKLSVFMGRGCWGWGHKHVIINLLAMQSILLLRRVDAASFLLWRHKGRAPPQDKTLRSLQKWKAFISMFCRRAQFPDASSTSQEKVTENLRPSAIFGCM